MATPDIFWDIYSLYFGHRSLEGFQRFAGLPETGILDGPTVETLYQPRCGVSDALRSTADAKWRKNRLDYYVDAYVEGLDEATISDVFREAWKSWADVADLRFTQVNSVNEADLILSTGRGARAGFDGPSGTLAWAQLPTGTDQPLLCRFDLDETWVHDLNRDILLLAVAAHEFGHLLGLDHDAQSSGALMAPFYKRGLFKPQTNDVRRIQGLYGVPTEPPPPSAPTEPIPAGWVDRVYRDVLGRGAAPNEVAAWQTRPSRHAVATGILASSEAHKVTVTGYYHKFLHREPDPAGLAGHTATLDQGKHPDTVMAAMLLSAEYLNQSGATNPSNPANPTDPQPGESIMRELVTLIVTVVADYLRQIPIVGRFVTEDMIRRMVDSLLRRLSTAGFQVTAPAALPLMDTAGLVAEMNAELGTPPTE